MQTSMFDVHKPFAFLPPFSHCMADGDSDTGAGNAADADDDAGADDTDFQALHREEVKNAKKQRKRAQEAEAARDAALARALSPEAAEEFKQLKDDAEARQTADDEAERERLANEGKFDELRRQDAKTHEASLAQNDKVHTEAIGKKDDEITRLGGIVAKLGAENPLQAELSKAGVQNVADALFFIQHSPSSEYHAVCGMDEQGNPVAKVVNRAGEDVVDPDNNGPLMTMAGLAAHFVGTETGQRFMPPSGDTGSGATRGTTSSKVTYESLLSNPAARKAFIDANGKEAFLKLAVQSNTQK